MGWPESIKCSVTVLFAGALSYGQLRPTVEQIQRDIRALEISIALDRQVYFPGEELRPRVVVRNRSARSLRVPVLFQERTMALRSYAANDDGKVSSLNDPGDLNEDPLEEVAPQAERTWTPSLSPHPANFGNLTASPSRGRFEIRLDYGGIGFRDYYRVAWPVLEALTEVPLQGKLTGDGRQVFRSVFSLRHENASYLCVGLITDASLLDHASRLNDSFGRLETSWLGAFRRISSHPNPIVSLRVTEDNLGGLTVILQDSSGAESRVDITAELVKR